MSQFLHEAKVQLKDRILLRDYGPEVDAFERLLAQANNSERIELARWMYEENDTAFYGTRMKAGSILYQEIPEIFWSISEKLAKSENLDNQDTVCSLLCEIRDPRAYEIVKPFLWDKYLQFDAIDFLMDIFPAEVMQCLRTLSSSEDDRIKKQAVERLAKSKNPGK